jgi:hypothetical protein
VLALVAGAAIAIAGWNVVGGGDDEPEEPAVATAEPPPMGGGDDEPEEPAVATAEPPPKRDAGPPMPRFPGPGFGVAQVRHGARVEILDRPGGGLVERVGSKTEFGSDRVFGVADTRRAWIGVIAPELGNDEVGWVKYRPGKLRLDSTRISVQVDLSERRVQLHRGDEVTRSYTVSVGRLGSGTPTGRFAVTDRITGDLGVYGCCAVALSAHQPNLPPGWIGGDRIAIHGWAGPVGEAASGGCLRATNEDAQEILDTVPLGSPVFIRA